jgi:hypothetical protein
MAMSRDFRIEIGFTGHHKTKKLIRRCGADGFLCLLKLWEYAAINYPEGALRGMDDNDIEDAVQWTGEPGAFTLALIQIGFLDETNPRKLHDWITHQPWVVGADKRKENAQKGGFAKAAKARSAGSSAGSVAGSRKSRILLGAAAPSNQPTLSSATPSDNNAGSHGAGESNG